MFGVILIVLLILIVAGSIAVSKFLLLALLAVAVLAFVVRN